MIAIGVENQGNVASARESRSVQATISLTSGRLRFESNQAMQRKRDFSNLLINIYGDENDYAL